jgi:hypothetical protein
MARTVEDPDFDCTVLREIAAVLLPKNARDPYFKIVGQDGSVSRLHRDRVGRVVSDGSGRIVEIQLAC